MVSRVADDRELKYLYYLGISKIGDCTFLNWLKDDPHLLADTFIRNGEGTLDNIKNFKGKFWNNIRNAYFEYRKNHDRSILTLVIKIQQNEYIDKVFINTDKCTVIINKNVIDIYGKKNITYRRFLSKINDHISLISRNKCPAFKSITYKSYLDCINEGLNEYIDIPHIIINV